MATFKNYDPDGIIVTVNAIPVQGFAPGTFVRVERDEDTFTEQVGAGGDVVRVRNRNRMGKVTITLLQSSPTNDQLSLMHRADELTAPGVVSTGVGQVMVKELNGATVAGGANAWVRKPPQIEFGAEASNREWVIQVADMDMFVGGEIV